MSIWELIERALDNLNQASEHMYRLSTLMNDAAIKIMKLRNILETVLKEDALKKSALEEEQHAH